MAKAKCAKIFCADIWHLQESDFTTPRFEAITNGAIAVDRHGRIVGCGPAAQIKKHWQAAKIQTFKNSVIVPGFVDTHIHFPQLDMIGCHGESLLGWLEKYTYPEEQDFSRPARAKAEAKRFFTEQLSNGTTTSLIFSSSNATTTDLLFAEAAKRGVRAVIGKTSMNRHAPAELLVDVASDIAASKKLIKKWHGFDERLFYAISPRFAPSCTEDLLQALGELFKTKPDLYVQTHYAESTNELKWVKELFPKHRSYLDVYDSHGLLGGRTVLAHAIHTDSEAINKLATTDTKLSHCPTSNLFLGSGLFPMRTYAKAGVDMSVGTDVGGGTSFSIWQTLAEAYKVQRLRGDDVQAEQLFYLATLGGAKALSLDQDIGNFAVGKYADFQVLQWDKTSLTRSRFQKKTATAKERLFALNFLFEKRLVSNVFVRGKSVYQ